jgi:hypothetical protein
MGDFSDVFFPFRDTSQKKLGRRQESEGAESVASLPEGEVSSQKPFLSYFACHSRAKHDFATTLGYI